VTNEQLAIAAGRGDEEAFARLVRALRPLIWTITRRYFAPGLEADDLYQAAVIGVWDGCRSFDPARARHSDFDGFAAMCVKRRLATAVKTALRDKHRILDGALRFEHSLDETGAEASTLHDVVASRAPSPLEQLVHRGDVATIVGAVRGMSELERAAVVGRAIGETYRETEQRLGISGMGGTVKSVDNALQRARVKLADALGVERFPLGAAA